MHKVLDKNMIEMEIVAFIPRTKRGFPPTVPLTEIVNAILYKLKTGGSLAPTSRWGTFSRKVLKQAIALPSFSKVERFRDMEGLSYKVS